MQQGRRGIITVDGSAVEFLSNKGSANPAGWLEQITFARPRSTHNKQEAYQCRNQWTGTAEEAARNLPEEPGRTHGPGPEARDANANLRQSCEFWDFIVTNRRYTDVDALCMKHIISVFSASKYHNFTNIDFRILFSITKTNIEISIDH